MKIYGTGKPKPRGGRHTTQRKDTVLPCGAQHCQERASTPLICNLLLEFTITEYKYGGEAMNLQK